VCSPRYLARKGAWSGPADLVNETLIHLEEPHRHCMQWSDWFSQFGRDYEPTAHGLRLNDYALVLG
jgi:DNA-binding transcriptional LysR family regulator